MTTLIAITGPTCGGKTTLKDKIVADAAGKVLPVVTTTTRQPRSGEVDGRDYNFRSKSEFAHLITARKLVEWVEIGGQRYGIEKDGILNACNVANAGVVVVNPKGVEALREWCGETGISLRVVLATASLDTLRQRLRERRGVAAASEINARMAVLETEVDRCMAETRYDLLINETQGRAVAELIQGAN